MAEIGLTNKEVELLKRSNKKFSEDPDSMKRIFHEYFRQYPKNMKFFPFRNVPLEELFEDTDFKIQCIQANNAIGACIENLHDYDVVKGILTRLGKRHIKYHIPTESFWEARKVIVEGLSKAVDEETYVAYAKYWDFLVNTILDAMRKT